MTDYRETRGILADTRFGRASYPMEWVYREDLEAALARCSKADRDLVLGWFDNMKQRQRSNESAAINRHQRRRDLDVVVRDQAAHIANLEAQLLPYLRDGYGTGGNQEALL